MGRRGRVVLRRIEDRVLRGICFRKRLAGLEKKAEELAVLCDAHVGFVVLSSSDGRLHHFAAPATIENIVERYEKQKGVHGRRILEKTKSKDFQVPKETIDKWLDNDDIRSIEETDISTLNMDQLSQIERLLEEELRWTRARKVQREAATAETQSSSIDVPSEQEKKQVAGGSQESAEEVEVEVVLSHSLSLGTGGGGDDGTEAEQRDQTPVDLNVPCWDAAPLQYF